MPSLKTKGKIQDPRLIYVSWLSGEAQEVKDWVDHFFDKVSLAIHGDEKHYQKPCRTDGMTGGSHYDNVDALLKRVTDIVAVMTDRYVRMNQEDAGPSYQREFARFVELRLKDKRDQDSKRAWLTPLNMLPWRRVVVNGVRLSEDRYWLVRLKPEGERFPWPTESKYDDHIYEAVTEILGDMDEEA